MLERKAWILTEIAEAENENQIHLTELERIALLDWILGEGWTIDKVRRVRRSLVHVEKFGKLAPEHWLRAASEPLYTAAQLEGEIKRRFAEMIERNREAFCQIHDESFYEAWIDHLEREGLRSARQMADRRLTELKGKVTRALDERIRSARRFILRSSESARDELYQALVRKYGRFKDDHVRKNLQVCAPFLLDEIEEMKRRMPAG